MKQRKGVSPLIATVLLISFTMAIAIILSNWVLDYSKQQTGALNERGSKQISCSGAWLDGQDAVYNTSHKRVMLDVQNKGNVPLGNLRMVLIYTNGSSAFYEIAPANLTLGPGETFSIWNTSVDSSAIKRIRVSHNCSDANSASGVSIESSNILIK